jgi:hypothetical protein
VLTQKILTQSANAGVPDGLAVAIGIYAKQKEIPMAQFTKPEAINHMTLFENSVLKGLTWQQIVGWLLRYAAPIVVQVLTAILPFLTKGGSKAVAVQWIEDALNALENGQPLPTLPA